MTAVEALQDIAEAIKAVFPAAEVWMRAEADACFSVHLPGVRPLVWVRFLMAHKYRDQYYREGGHFPSWLYVVEESWPDRSVDGLRGHTESGSGALAVALEILHRLAAE